MDSNGGRGPPPGNTRSASQGGHDPPPPLSSQSSTSTWAKRIGSIPMLQPQNNVNAPGDSGTVVNVTVNRNGGENLPTASNAHHEDVHNLARTTRADHKIYSNQLLTKERGYPLWVPGPGMQLPIEYRRHGISIGDVGIITSSGEFDFLFNILQPPEHAINRGSVPQGFSPIPRQELERDIHETIVYGPNTYLASSSVRKTSMKWISETSIDQRFESTAKEAAILIMPDGATTQNLLNTWGVRDTISSNGKDWYTYTRTTRGRYIKNGDIRVVVGVDKASSWGIATSACNTGQTASYVFKHDPTHTYQWDCIGGSGRVGPQKREMRDLIEDDEVPENQCVFVRTINFTLPERNFPSESVQQRSGPGRCGDSASNDRGDSSVEFNPVEVGPITRPYTRLLIQVHHPSAALHNSLHERFPDASMVITEDMDWISVLNDDDVVFPESGALSERILKAHEPRNHQGIVQIVRKNDRRWPSKSGRTDKGVIEGSISSAIRNVFKIQEKRKPSATNPQPIAALPLIEEEASASTYTAYPTPIPSSKKIKKRIGRAFHSVDAPSTAPLISLFGNKKYAPSLESSSHSLFTPTSRETKGMAPIPVALSHSDRDDGGDCPICLEPLGINFRLSGEKPHIVPECGHILHEACFTAEYNPPPSRTLPQKSNLKVCGVCRKPMKIAGSGDGGRSNSVLLPFPSGSVPDYMVPDLAVPTDMGDSQSPRFPGGDTSFAQDRAAVRPHGPSESAENEHIVPPSIHILPEFSSLTRTNDANQPLTCIVVIELPGRRVRGNVPGPVIPENYGKTRSQQHSGSGSPSPIIPLDRKNDRLAESFLNQRQLSDIQYASTSTGLQTHGYSSNALIHSEEDFSLYAIAEDLRNRIINWEGHPLSDLGPLQMHEILSVRQESAPRELHVYLFKEAILCVVEGNKHGLRISTHATSSKGVLRLKGKIYVGQIKNVTASSAAGEMSLTIDVEEDLASFILLFKDLACLESWKNNIQALVSLYHAQNRMARHQESERPPNLGTFGGSQMATNMFRSASNSTVDGLLHNSGTSTSSSGSHMARQDKLALLGGDDESSSCNDSPTPRTSFGPSNSLSPLEHPQMDLILVVSLPLRNSLPSTAQLKISVIKATLDFLVASLGPKDRLSVVTFEVGGDVRKTPFLMVGRLHNRTRLEKFIDETGVKLDENQDEFLVRGSKEEETSVGTAVKHGLDIVLQRKERNPVSGMILVSDASDSVHRTQIDFVLAHAEAANIPIHSFGYGPHDAAPLWLMSEHTSGTYTFVKDWHDLRDCVAGCVGGMMSIGLLDVKLHLKVVDGYRFKIREVSGGPSPQSVISVDGQNVDVDVGELRYGERKELLIELELDNGDQQRLVQQRAGRNRASMSATAQFHQSFGLDDSLDEAPDFVDGMMDEMIDDVPVLEVDVSFFNPAAAKNISRLAHPVLLTIALHPGPQNSQKPPVSDPVIVRRRMELLASDMIRRALALVSKRNFPQAQKVLGEARRILHTVLQTISRFLPPHTNVSGSRNSQELLMLAAVNAMQAILQDLRLLSEALEDDVESFAHDQRNFGVQQAMILRDQKSWSERSAIERLFWTTDNSIELVSRSIAWVVPGNDTTAPASPTSGSACQSSGFNNSEDPPFSDLRNTPSCSNASQLVSNSEHYYMRSDVRSIYGRKDPSLSD